MTQSPYNSKKLGIQDFTEIFFITAIYAAIALVGLGSKSTPRNAWLPEKGDSIVAEFPARENVTRIAYLNGYQEVFPLCGNVNKEHRIKTDNPNELSVLSC